MQNATKKSWIFDLILIAILIGVFFALFTGAHNLLVPDEGRYTEIAREMAASSNYVTPFFNGIVFLDKPILFYWLECSAIKLFGISEWSLRLWPVIIGVFGCLITYIAGRMLFNRRTGVLAAFILATSPLYYFMSHYANMDLEVAVFIGTSLFFFIIAAQLEDSVKRSLFLWSAYIFAAFAFLTKGMIGIVFPGMIIGCWIAISNNWRLLKKMHLISGLIIFALIVSPWFILEQRANHEFFHYFFVTQHFTRFLTKNFNNPNPFWFYLPVIIIGLIPHVLFLGQAIWQKIRLVFSNRKQHQAELFLLLWPLLVLVFFSIPLSKLLGYILPVFPPLALLIASYLDLSLSNFKTAGIKIGINIYTVLFLITAIILFYLPFFQTIHGIKIAELKIYCYFLAAVFFGSSLFTLFFSYRKKWLQAIIVLVLTSLITNITSSAVMPKLGFKSTKPLAVKLNSLLQPNDAVVVFYNYFYDLPVYIQKPVLVVEDWELYKNIDSDDWRGILTLASQFKGSQKEWLINIQQLQNLWRSKHVFIVAKKDQLAGLTSLLDTEIFQLEEDQGRILITNIKP